MGGRNKKTQPWREATGTIIYLHERRREGGSDGVDQRARTHGGLQAVQSGLRVSKFPKHGQKQQWRLV